MGKKSIFFMQKSTILDNRGYCARISLCAYSLGVPNFKITLPPKTYPSTAPYASLSVHFKNLVKEGLMPRTIIKSLLYPAFNKIKVNTREVRLRRNQNIQSTRRRRSICSSSDLSQQESAGGGDGTSVTSSVGFVQYGGDKMSVDSNDTFVDHGPGVVVDCTRDIFACFNQPDGKGYEKVPVQRDSDGSFIFAHETSAAVCDTGLGRDSLKYYSKPVRFVIDHNQSCRADSLIHTSTVELMIGRGTHGCVSSRTTKGSPTDEMSEASGFDRRPLRANMACEDLVNMDESMKIKSDKSALNQKSMVDERHSMPMLFVGNRFNCSSLTEVFIPSYKDRLDIKLTNDPPTEPSLAAAAAIESDAKNSQLSLAPTTTHSSSIDIPALVPAPDQLSTELLYNSVECTTSPTATVHDADGSHVIKPPSMFDGHRSLSKELSPFDKHTLNSDKTVATRRTPSQTKDKRCVSYHYLNLQGNDTAADLHPPGSTDNRKSSPLNARKCGCCTTSSCHSPRSSDSGMAGSCTISSPDAPILSTGNEYEQFNEDFLHANPMQRLHSGLMHSQSTHNFGRFNEISFVDGVAADSNHDSGQYGHCNYEPETVGADTSTSASAVNNNMFELSMSRDTVKRQSRCQSAERTSDIQTKPQSPKREAIFKTGMYAHWWKKEALPADMLRDICRLRGPRDRDAQSTSNQLLNAGEMNRSISSWGSGKPKYHVFCLSLFLDCFSDFPAIVVVDASWFYCAVCRKLASIETFF